MGGKERRGEKGLRRRREGEGRGGFGQLEWLQMKARLYNPLHFLSPSADPMTEILDSLAPLG